jgi:DNA-binding NtrC family response regulator
VLLVDDEEHVLSALRRTLRREGYQVLTAGSAREALRILEEGPVAAVVSDHKMPGTSGLALLGQVARRWPAVGRLLLTGWPGDIPRGELEAVGAALLEKPWDDAELKAALRRALGGAP